MSPYRRPPVQVATYRDGSGAEIAYGSRYWTADVEPPDDAYSRCTHPDRFEPVELIGRALVDHLVTTFDVDVFVEGAVTTLTPRTGGGTSLTLTMPLTGLPGVRLVAGYRFENQWPDCGCDACDDSVPDLLDDLEATVLTIVEGGLSEWRTGPAPWMPLVTDDGGVAVNDEVVPWQVHARLDGRLETALGGWSSDEPEPVDLSDEPHRWQEWANRTR